VLSTPLLAIRDDLCYHVVIIPSGKYSPQARATAERVAKVAARILVVDDDPGAIKLISYTLRREGYEVATAPNGLEALTMVRQEHFDLVILDIMMPGIDGYEVCRRLRKNPGTADLPVIILTARSMVKDKVSGFRSGTDEYVTKPLLPNELVAQVKALLLRSSLSQGAGSRPHGQTFSFMGVKGGVGTSTLAINLAYLLAQEGISVVLADLSLVPTAAMQVLDVAPSQALSTLLGKDTLDISARRLEPYLVELASGLKVLPPPSGTSVPALLTEQARLEGLNDQLASLAEFLVLDLGCAFYLPTRVLLGRADRLVLVSESTRLGLKMLQEGWQILSASTPDHDRIEIAMVNRTRSSVPVRAPDVEKVLGRNAIFFVSVPELTDQAVESHVPLAVSQPESLFALQIRELAQSLLQGQGDTAH